MDRTSFHTVFLPFIGIAMMLTLIGRKLISVLVRVTVKSTGFGWSPTEAYLDGKQCCKNGQRRREGMRRRCDEVQYVKRQKIQLSEL